MTFHDRPRRRSIQSTPGEIILPRGTGGSRGIPRVAGLSRGPGAIGRSDPFIPADKERVSGRYSLISPSAAADATGPRRDDLGPRGGRRGAGQEEAGAISTRIFMKIRRRESIWRVGPPLTGAADGSGAPGVTSPSSRRIPASSNDERRSILAAASFLTWSRAIAEEDTGPGRLIRLVKARAPAREKKAPRRPRWQRAGPFGRCVRIAGLQIDLPAAPSRAQIVGISARSAVGRSVVYKLEYGVSVTRRQTQRRVCISSECSLPT